MAETADEQAHLRQRIVDALRKRGVDEGLMFEGVLAQAMSDFGPKVMQAMIDGMVDRWISDWKAQDALRQRIIEALRLRKIEDGPFFETILKMTMNVAGPKPMQDALDQLIDLFISEPSRLVELGN